MADTQLAPLFGFKKGLRVFSRNYSYAQFQLFFFSLKKKVAGVFLFTLLAENALEGNKT